MQILAARCYEIYKEIVLDTTKQKVMMFTMNFLVILPKLELHRQTMTAAVLQKIFTQTIFLLKVLIDVYSMVIAKCLVILYLKKCIHDRKTYKKLYVSF